jgi:hypothetical protein
MGMSSFSSISGWKIEFKCDKDTLKSIDLVMKLEAFDKVEVAVIMFGERRTFTLSEFMHRLGFNDLGYIKASIELMTE